MQTEKNKKKNLKMFVLSEKKNPTKMERGIEIQTLNVKTKIKNEQDDTLIVLEIDYHNVKA